MLKAGRQIVGNSTLCSSHTQMVRVGEPDDSSDRFLEKEVKQLCMKILQFYNNTESSRVSQLPSLKIECLKLTTQILGQNVINSPKSAPDPE